MQVCLIGSSPAGVVLSMSGEAAGLFLFSSAGSVFYVSISAARCAFDRQSLGLWVGGRQRTAAERTSGRGLRHAADATPRTSGSVPRRTVWRWLNILPSFEKSIVLPCYDSRII